MKFTQLPGTLDVEFVVGDEVAMNVDFDNDIVAYALEAPIYVSRVFVTGVGGTAASRALGEVVENWQIYSPDPWEGKVVLGLSEAQTRNLPVDAQYRWFLRWVTTVGYTRTVLSGSLTTRDP